MIEFLGHMQCSHLESGSEVQPECPEFSFRSAFSNFGLNPWFQIAIRTKIEKLRTFLVFWFFRPSNRPENSIFPRSKILTWRPKKPEWKFPRSGTFLNFYLDSFRIRARNTVFFRSSGHNIELRMRTLVICEMRVFRLTYSKTFSILLTLNMPYK